MHSGRGMHRLWLAFVVLGGGCTVEAYPVDDLVDDALRAGKNPCEDADICERANVKHAPGDPHRFVGTNQRDVIFGTAGKDVIFGNGGDDLRSPPPLGGDDEIRGADGNDVIDGGGGRNTITYGADD